MERAIDSIERSVFGPDLGAGIEGQEFNNEHASRANISLHFVDTAHPSASPDLKVAPGGIPQARFP